MIRIASLISLIGLFVFGHQWVLADVVLSPDAVTRNDFGNFGGGLGSLPDLINQNGLPVGSGFISGTTGYASYIATLPIHQSNNDGGHWFGFNAPSTGVMDFDLGEEYSVRSLAFFSNPFRAFNEIEVQTSNTPGFLTFQSVGTFTPLFTNDGNSVVPVQDIDLIDSQARYVRFNIQDGFNSSLPSIGEVAFGVSAIPEPSGILFLSALAGFLIMRRKRTQTADHWSKSFN